LNAVGETRRSSRSMSWPMPLAYGWPIWSPMRPLRWTIRDRQAWLVQRKQAPKPRAI